MRAITVCVEYDDYLAITLPKNRGYFDEYLIITTLNDTATNQLAVANNCQILFTDAFYRDGARFNKGLAIEQGFDVLGRRGWLTVLDADIVLPPVFKEFKGEPEYLYSPYRRLVHNVDRYVKTGEIQYVKRYDVEHAGYCQIFNASSSYVKNKRPWYGIDWHHAGGCDSVFQNHWPNDRKLRPVWDVLHLGRTNKNWTGRWTERLDGLPSHPDARTRRESMFLNVRPYWWKKTV